jgi:DNA-binding transcriptional regulator YiaG
MKKVFGEWFLDINLSKLQNILRLLVHKTISLTGEEIRFIRKYFEKTTTEFGLIFGATYAAVLKWEKMILA